MMKDNTIIFFCVNLIFVENALSQYCYSRAPVESYGLFEAGPFNAMSRYEPYVLQALALPPPSFSIESDGLIINGEVEVSGRLPFASAVSLEGIVPTIGKGSVVYNCGVGESGLYSDRPYGTVGYPIATEYPGYMGMAGSRYLGIY